MATFTGENEIAPTYAFSKPGEHEVRPYKKDNKSELLGLGIRWVFFVITPFQRVVSDVFADSDQFPFVADDTFMIIPLPQSTGKG